MRAPPQGEHRLETAAPAGFHGGGAQVAAGAVKAGAHGDRVQPRIAGDGRHGQPLGLAQQEHQAQFGRQAGRRLFQQRADLVAAGGGLGLSDAPRPWSG